MTHFSRRVGSDPATVEQAHAVRRRVFIEEQGVDETLEMDGRDADATHVVLHDGSGPVATARIRFPEGTTAKIERVAVVPTSRGVGLGTRVMAAAEAEAGDRGATTAVLHAQCRVRAFYERLGYEAVGEPFEEADIPHVEMRKPLD